MEKRLNGFVLLWPVLRAAWLLVSSDRAGAVLPENHRAAPLRGLGSLETVVGGPQTSLLSLHFFPHHFSASHPLFSLLGRGFTLEPESVFLCSEVCVLLVPFAWGQALVSVEVLRVHPNVQDLGVSARLSESGGKERRMEILRTPAISFFIWVADPERTRCMSMMPHTAIT